jgi:hypothetical protein
MRRLESLNVEMLAAPDQQISLTDPFLMKTLPQVASEMALHVLAYDLTRVMNIIGIQPLVAAIRA